MADLGQIDPQIKDLFFEMDIHHGTFCENKGADIKIMLRCIRLNDLDHQLLEFVPRHLKLQPKDLGAIGQADKMIV